MNHSTVLEPVVNHIFKEVRKPEALGKKVIIYVSEKLFDDARRECSRMRGETDHYTLDFIRNQTLLGYPVFISRPTHSRVYTPPPFHVALI